MFTTDCGVALDLLCQLDCDFPLGIHVPYPGNTVTDHTYDMVDEFPMGIHSLMDIVNLKQFHNLFYPVIVHRSDILLEVMLENPIVLH